MDRVPVVRGAKLRKLPRLGHSGGTSENSALLNIKDAPDGNHAAAGAGHSYQARAYAWPPSRVCSDGRLIP